MGKGVFPLLRKAALRRRGGRHMAHAPAGPAHEKLHRTDKKALARACAEHAVQPGKIVEAICQGLTRNLQPVHLQNARVQELANLCQHLG